MGLMRYATRYPVVPSLRIAFRDYFEAAVSAAQRALHARMVNAGNEAAPRQDRKPDDATPPAPTSLAKEDIDSALGERYADVDSASSRAAGDDFRPDADSEASAPRAARHAGPISATRRDASFSRIISPT